MGLPRPALTGALEDLSRTSRGPRLTRWAAPVTAMATSCRRDVHLQPGELVWRTNFRGKIDPNEMDLHACAPGMQLATKLKSETAWRPAPKRGEATSVVGCIGDCTSASMSSVARLAAQLRIFARLHTHHIILPTTRFLSPCLFFRPPPCHPLPIQSHSPHLQLEPPAVHSSFAELLANLIRDRALERYNSCPVHSQFAINCYLSSEAPLYSTFIF